MVSSEGNYHRRGPSFMVLILLVGSIRWVSEGHQGAHEHYKKRHIRDILGRTKKNSVIHMTLL